jgi:hypothetical protein
MPHGTIDDGLWRHPKVMNTPDLAIIGLIALCWSYTNGEGTDGLIPGAVALTLARGNKRLLKEAVKHRASVGLKMSSWLVAEGDDYRIYHFGQSTGKNHQRNLTVAQWAEYRAGQADSGGAGGRVTAKKDGLKKARAALAEKRAAAKQAVSDSLSQGLSTRLEKTKQPTNPGTPDLVLGTDKPPPESYKKATPDGVADGLDAFLKNGLKTGDEESVADVIRWLRSRGKYDANEEDMVVAMADSVENDSPDLLLMKLRKLRPDQMAGQTAKALLHYAALSGNDIATHLEKT